MTHGIISAPYRDAFPPVFRRCAFNESRGATPGSLFLYSSRYLIPSALRPPCGASMRPNGTQ